MNIKDIKLVIFDMDGLLLETEKLYMDLFCKTMDELGYKADKELYLPCVGVGSANGRAYLKSKLGQDFPAERHEGLMFKRAYDYVIEKGVDHRPGVSELLDLLDSLNINKGIASSNDKEFVLHALKNSNLINRFSVINTAQDVKKTKPSPDLFLKTAKDFGVPASQTLVLEDSENGVLAANAAQMRVFMIPDIKMPSPEIEKKATAVFNSLHDVVDVFKRNF
ncbi:putative phosphatase/phosphohexomutase [Elusimicrobium minutum Pei191]|uniref:Putative phosphatase/phosphohexomutase n=1 Tax=Elusimicrobium minutum (strain Pei191) TaxID=445932 RepID=B2KCX9_ELUMP|nr:HAD family phosphatase [Elusimicrobium minutum]ACC98375.1 putative phosphatase/phosphohexomutase [Elusimicrobium minutum Pei191]